MMDQLLDLFQPGRTIYLPGASGEILSLTERLAAEPERMAGVHIISCLLPGFNKFDYAALHPTARLTTFLLPPELRRSFEAGRARVLPLSYSGIAAYIGQRLHLDVAVAHVATPGSDGQASLGIAVDFTAIAMAAADTAVGVVNPRMPRVRRGTSVLPRLMIESDSPLVTAGKTDPDPELERIASGVAELIPDGSTLQIGIGGAPAAVWPMLRNHRNLRLASGLLAQEARTLFEKGVFAPQAIHHAGVAFGDDSFYDYLGEQDQIAFCGVDKTHNILELGTLGRLHAVNSAVEVDLMGQVNLEWRGGRLISGVGGAPDFARGAAISPGGRSIIAMPATARHGSISRIVTRLTAPTASLGRDLADLVVTEHGVADLRDRSVHERAKALIEIAAPQFRAGLAEQWHAMAIDF